MLPSGYVVPNDFLFFMGLIYGLPPLLLIAGLFFKKPGDPSQFGPPPQGKSIASAVLTVLRKTMLWQGRATRSEFWWYFLFGMTVIMAVVGIVLGWNNTAGLIVWFILSIPGFAVGTRRLHDIGRSGWWQVFGVTGTGILVLLVLWMLPPVRQVELSQVDVFE